MSIHLTVVRFNKNHEANVPLEFIQKFDYFHEIWTSNPYGKFNFNINEALEFSGYQEAIGVAINQIKQVNLEPDCKRHAIIIANDTFFSAHFISLTKFMLRAFELVHKRGIELQPQVTGLLMDSDLIASEVSGPSGYFSTWLFMVEGTTSELEKLRFYDPNITTRNFMDDLYPYLPANYRYSVDAWLQPSGWLKGWYQALPGRPLPPSTLNRKRFSIFLEHSLPIRLKESGFIVSCLSQRLGYFSAARLSALRLLDRIYVNTLKIRYYLKVFTLYK